MVKQSVPNFGFVNMATLGIVDVKIIISAVLVIFIDQISVQVCHIIKKITGKSLRAIFVGFANDKFFPRRIEII